MSGFAAITSDGIIFDLLDIEFFIRYDLFFLPPIPRAYHIVDALLLIK